MHKFISVLLGMVMIGLVNANPFEEEMDADVATSMILTSTLFYCNEVKCVDVQTGDTISPNEHTLMNDYNVMLSSNDFTQQQLDQHVGFIADFWSRYLNMPKDPCDDDWFADEYKAMIHCGKETE